MIGKGRRIGGLALAWLLLGAPSQQVAGLANASEPAKAADKTRPEGAARTLAEDYCIATADKATEARIAWQTEALKRLQTEVDAKVQELDLKRKAVEEWVEKQNALLSRAEKGLVEIYTKMEPEAAAKQLSEIDTGTAVSVIRQLSPRSASAILSSMEAKKAATIVQVISAVSVTQRRKGSGS